MDDHSNAAGITPAPPAYLRGNTDPELQRKPTVHREIHNRVVKLDYLEEQPEYIDCPHCETRQQTKVSHPSSSATMLAGAFCCLCCGIITFWIPCACHWFADTDHTCSHCNNLVAHKSHDGKMTANLPATERTGISMYQPVQPMKQPV
ncbi:hypothetical protein EDD36DRAFT_211974 [Exophiala viscosa]|uniref:LITAF domain-containing protein n=2 Tax=Exophiala viscosa TaxID=2486360 RepID=A0AAN6DXE5_9EURO|nr:hypothetical protein EDD36DRAFT_211974 [Exophiala viscosa]